MKDKSVMWRGLICGLLATLFWGINGTVSQYLMHRYALDPFWLAGIRMLSAGLLIIGAALIRKGREAFAIFRDPTDRRRLLRFALFGLLFNQLCFFTAVNSSDAGTATVLQSLSTIVILIVTAVRDRVLPNRIRIIAVVLAFIGVYLVSTDSHTGLSLSPQGLFWGLMLAVSAAAYILLSRPLVGRWSSTTVIGYGMLLGGIVYNLLLRTWRFHPVLEPQAYLGFAYIVLFGTIAAFSLYLQCVHDLGPVPGTLIGNFEPLTATILTALLLNTAFTVRDIAGFVLILGAVILVQLKG